jgi:tripartite ATP-independent transporter DctM subunit
VGQRINIRAAAVAASKKSEAVQFSFVRAVDALSNLTGAASALAVLAMACIVCYEVFSRYVLNSPTYWVTEIATYTLVGVTFTGLASAQKAGSHIRVELVLGSVSEPIRDRMILIADWLGLFVAIFAAWQMIAFNYREFVHDTRDWGLLATPQWLPQLPVSIGLVTLALAILADICRLAQPSANAARWAVVVCAIALAAVLWRLGSLPVPIAGTRLDWGSVAICAFFLMAVPLWSGLRTALAVIGLLVALGLVFWAARGSSLLVIGLVLVATMLLLLVLGVRIALALALVGVFGLYFLLSQPQLSAVAERSWSSVNTFTLTAVPMFVLMSALLLRSGVTAEMFDALVRWFGRTPGGLAHASVGASAIFAAVCGSSLATAATLGNVACPEMIKRGYSPRLTYGVTAAGATLGIMIPPSIAMIIYGSTVGAPVDVLFIAGIVPGLILAAAFMLGALVWATAVPGAAPPSEAYPWADKVRALLGMLPFTAVILTVLGSIYAGVATPTEAGAVGAAMSLVLCALRGRLNTRTLFETALETARVTAFLLLIVVGAAILSWVFDYLRLPRSVVEAVKSADLAPWMIVVVISMIYLVLGMLIESISMMLMTLPVTFPIITALGFDPIWFGIYLVVMVELGLITPPVGLVLFVLRGMSGNVPLSEIVYGVLPFAVIMLAFVGLIYVFPGIVAWLPSQMR